MTEPLPGSKQLRVYTLDGDGHRSVAFKPSKLHISRVGKDAGLALCSTKLVLNYPEDWEALGSPDTPAPDLCRRCFRGLQRKLTP